MLNKLETTIPLLACLGISIMIKDFQIHKNDFSKTCYDYAIQDTGKVIHTDTVIMKSTYYNTQMDSIYHKSKKDSSRVKKGKPPRTKQNEFKYRKPVSDSLKKAGSPIPNDKTILPKKAVLDTIKQNQ